MARTWRATPCVARCCRAGSTWRRRPWPAHWRSGNLHWWCALGLAGSRAAVSIERVALNLIDARIADNAGNQPVDLPVLPGAAPAYFSTLPVKALAAALRRARHSRRGVALSGHVRVQPGLFRPHAPVVPVPGRTGRFRAPARAAAASGRAPGRRAHGSRNPAACGRVDPGSGTRAPRRPARERRYGRLIATAVPGPWSVGLLLAREDQQQRRGHAPRRHPAAAFRCDRLRAARFRPTVHSRWLGNAPADDAPVRGATHLDLRDGVAAHVGSQHDVGFDPGLDAAGIGGRRRRVMRGAARGLRCARGTGQATDAGEVFLAQASQPFLLGLGPAACPSP
jgi:hypothetical protein